MKQLGGDVITFNKKVSSLQKGESFEDTIRTLECYGDIMVLRHPIENNIYIAKELLNIPLLMVVMVVEGLSYAGTFRFIYNL